MTPRRDLHEPRSIAPATALAIVQLRRRYLTHSAIARSLGLSASTVGRLLRRAGLARWSALAPSEPVLRYEPANPGDMVHIDTKKLGRIERMSHRVTGNRRDSVDGAGWEFLFVAVDDHARLGFMGFPTITPWSARPCSIVGRITTTGTARTKESAG